MMSKATKPQFRTPFRGNSQLPLSQISMSQTSEPRLPMSPTSGLVCSQMSVLSTPGITVDAVRQLIERRAGKNYATEGKPQDKMNQDRKEMRGPMSHDHVMNGPKLASAECKMAKKDPHKRLKENGPRKNIRVKSKSDQSNVRSAERIQGVSTIHTEKIPIHSQETQSQEPSLQTSSASDKANDSLQETYSRQKSPAPQKPSKPPKGKPNAKAQATKAIGEQKSITKFAKVTKAQKMFKQKYLHGEFFANRSGPSNIVVSQANENVVVVRSSDYVYREKWSPEITVSNNDVYTFISETPGREVTASTAKRLQRDRIRHDVLKVIYRVETELAVLRERRQKLRKRLTKGKNVLSLTSRNSIVLMSEP